MEQRIKIVWILTLITAILMIAGQGYWLYNQYEYSTEEYIQRLHKELIEIERQEIGIRIQNSHQTKHTLSTSTDFHIQADIRSDLDSVSLPQVNTEWTITWQDESKEGTFHVKDIDSQLLFDAVQYYSTNLHSPFQKAMFDSLLVANHIQIENLRLAQTDSALWESTYTHIKKGLLRQMHLIYPYNPLKREVVEGEISIPLAPLLRLMAWQLAGSCVLIILLIFCLVYQIHTIMRQQKTNEMRKSFVNTMIHELKRPVQTLTMCIAFLNNKQMRTDEQMMDSIVRDSMFELDNLSAYLAKIREMTRADYENTPLSVRTFDLSETIEKLIRLSSTSADKSIRFTTSFSENPLLVTADPVHLANSLSNLIENAIKYSNAKVHISIEASLINKSLQISVTDDGIGIPANEQVHIFEKFYRAQNIPDRNLPGIGLGLSYVKLMVKAHGGNIYLQSQVGKGSTFTLEIPQ